MNERGTATNVLCNRPPVRAVRMAAVLATVSSFFGVGFAIAQQSSTAPIPGRSWALLIGIENYHRANKLTYTINDVHQISQTLRSRDGFEPDCILEVTDESPNPRYQPLKSSLLAEVPAWLNKPGKDDTIIVYFSGHGFRDAAGKMYLAPIDCDPENAAATGVPIEWFRQQIGACRAGFKLLVLDSCHAGSEKGEEDRSSVAAKDLGDPFQSLEKVVTLASSTADQKSQIWEDKRQSLFSYWLNQGLKGHADKDSNGAVDVDELYDYVSRAVQHTSEVYFPRPQTPVRIVRSGVSGVPVVVRLLPQTLRQVIGDMSEQLSDILLERRVSKVGVLEFTNDTKLGELLGANFGLLGRYCAEEVERELGERSVGKFNLVDRRRLQTTLKSQGFSLNDLGSAPALAQLSTSAGGIPALALGTLRNRAGRVVNLQCQLMETKGDEVLGTVGGTALLDESEWAMLGRSVAIKPEDRKPEAAPGKEPARPLADQVIERIDRRSEGAHPLSDPNFPYRIKLMIGGQERVGEFRGNDYFVPVRAGEVYEIWVENKSKRVTCMRLLVDGLNTLPEPEKSKGVETYVTAARVNLDDALWWVLDPARSKVFAVRGFVSQTGAEGELREFTVVDADQSLAARQEFTDQIGLITAAFYAPAGATRSVGTGLGRRRAENLAEYREVHPGNLLAVVHLRYVDSDALKR
jgi:hypothetical protein